MNHDVFLFTFIWSFLLPLNSGQMFAMASSSLSFLQEDCLGLDMCFLPCTRRLQNLKTELGLTPYQPANAPSQQWFLELLRRLETRCQDEQAEGRISPSPQLQYLWSPSRLCTHTPESKSHRRAPSGLGSEGIKHHHLSAQVKQETIMLNPSWSRKPSWTWQFYGFLTCCMMHVLDVQYLYLCVEVYNFFHIVPTLSLQPTFPSFLHIFFF